VHPKSRRHSAASPFRKHWALDPKITFLNHGAFGACPKPILKLQAELRREMEAEPVQFLWQRFEERLEPSRKVLAKFLGTASKDLVFTTNATTGVNAVVRSLKLQARDELLTTSLDYNACRNVLNETAARSGAKVVVAPVPFPVRRDDEIVEAVLNAVSKKTRLALVDHVTSDTGIVLPVERLVRELEARGVDALIDGAHAPGMVPLNLTRLRPAYYTGNLHKWVCAPKGAAFLWVREDLQAGIQPPVISHGNNRTRPGFTEFQDRFDWCGTFDPTAWFCVGDAIRWMGSLLPGGWAEVRRRNHTLVVAGRRLLCERLGVEPPCPESMLGSLAALPFPERLQNRPRGKNKIEDEQQRLFDKFKIEVPFNRIRSLRHFRISAQLYNSMANYEALADALAG
jgi:isopenicillin-N epimerase